ncbi:MAG TPA: hypothetical protein PKA33_01380 [Amaricoccus sp.]|uniref:hypothetical protein n=1 Tax=Amaricoccus sp. TaxID=1872485 RepID=UPI002C0BBB0D|nr:hypothetical protein [Amaricoccus sp.]HMQ92576.1 hypothetical protein [Amaricoccus sp.]HMR51253.1 hypothetical protein [Amaricoccus sp.]HMR60046.1 hypothetical protein [Amaricoccus sp.]HMT97997.1 hypothetical protein [Amaricoccus sp.]
MSSYNAVFEKFVDAAQDDQSEIVGIIAYGIYKTAKREWVIDFKEREQRSPTEAELLAYVSTWTESRVDGAKQNAAQVIAEFAQTILDEQEPRVLRAALRGRFWPAVWQSVVGAALYTVLLIVVALILSFSGVDLLSILANTRVPSE